MKKILTILALLLMSAIPARASLVEEYCLPEPYPVGGAIANGISNASGVNFLFTKTIELAIQNQLKKELNSNFNVELYAFGGKNLIDGKFRKIEVTARKIASDDVYMHNFKAESLCGYNRVVLKDSNIYYDENFLVDFSGEITSDDLAKSLLTKKNLEAIDRINLNIFGTSVFKIHEPSAKIENDRISMSIKATISNFLVSKTFYLKTNYALKIEDGKVVFSDVQLGNTYGLSANTILPIINMLNPFRLNVKIDNINTATIWAKNIKIENDTIYMDGTVLVPKSI